MQQNRETLGDTKFVRAVGMYVYLWEYRVAPGDTGTFLRHYGPEGSWVRLFRGSAGYIGTELLRDRDDPERFVTVDRLVAGSDHAAFLQANGEAYSQLDAECETLTQFEALIGHFTVDSAPSRVDPDWHRLDS